MNEYPRHAIDEHAVISITDSLGKIIYVNDKMCDISQYDRNELINQDHRILNSHYHSKTFMREMWVTIMDGHVWHGKMRNIGKYGSIFWCETTIIPIKNKNGLIDQFFCIRTDITRTKLYEEQLVENTQYDFLTRLPNRFLLNDRLDQTIRKCKRDDGKFAVLFIDLDNFKAVNDLVGHEGGDKFLVEAVERIKGCVRGSDTVARYGGDEFVVLLQDIRTTMDVNVIADKICGVMREPFHIEKELFRSGASIGIATFPDNGTDIKTLLGQADLAMYKAKQSGKGHYRQLQGY